MSWKGNQEERNAIQFICSLTIYERALPVFFGDRRSIGRAHNKPSWKNCSCRWDINLCNNSTKVAASIEMLLDYWIENQWKIWSRGIFISLCFRIDETWEGLKYSVKKWKTANYSLLNSGNTSPYAVVQSKYGKYYPLPIVKYFLLFFFR